MASESDVDVEHAIDTPPPKPKRTFDKRRAMLRAEGLTDEQIERVLPIVTVHRRTQRQLPVGATVNSPNMVTFFHGRDDDQIMADCVKGIRNDGGPYGPVGMYARLLVSLRIDESTARSAGELIAEKVGHRITAIRTNVVATVNEIKRRRAEREGRNPRAEKYLRVR